MRVIIIILWLFTYLLTSKGINNSNNSVDIEKIITDNKLKWSIDNLKKEKQHYFDLKIDHCFKGLIKNTAEEPTTFHLMQKELYKCIIEEIKFKDDKSVNEVYTVLYNEAEKVRKGARNEFGNICFELREAQFFYAIKKDKTIYLISDANHYNYQYKGGSDSVDAIIQRDQIEKNEIIYDDIARFIQEY